MKKFLRENHQQLFFGCWFLINLVQAGTTGLMDDEAYYWVYSLFPAWGYFDHPPMIALLIKAGTTLFPGELGVRFFILLLNTLTLVLIYRMLPRKNDLLFYAICGSLMLAQIGGILAVPDLPLLFFAALYFLLYKRFLQNTNLFNAILFGTGIALMLYSKYHGILLVFFTLISNPSLFKNIYTYLVAGIALALFAPHIYWQLQHDLPSVQYHLFERNASSYEVGFTIEYILGQLALAGPVVGWLLLYASFQQHTTNQFEKTLKYCLVGIYVFFLFSTFKGRVEANWTVPAFVALIILSHTYLTTHEALTKWLYRLLPITLVLVLALRIFMALDIERVQSISKDEFHGNREWVKEVGEKAGGIPVVMLNSYQLPSKYWFYSGNMAFGLNTPYYRRNNYNFWPIEDSLFGKKVMVMGRKDSILFNKFFNHQVLKESGLMFIDDYYSFSKVQFTDLKIENGYMNFKSKSPANYLGLFQEKTYDTASILFAAIEPNVGVYYYSTGLTVKDIRSERQDFNVKVPAVLMQKKIIKLAITSSIPGHPSLNSTNAKR